MQTDAFAEQANREAQFLDDDDSIFDQDPESLARKPEEIVDEEEVEEPDVEDEEPEDEPEAEEPEDEPEDEETEDEPEDDESEKAEPEEPKPHLVPKARYDSVKSRLDKALDELEAMRKSKTSGLSAADAKELTSQLDEISSKFNEAVSVGDLDAANKLRAQERALTEQVFEMKARSVAAQEVENLRYQDYVSKVEAAYPELNEDDPRFSKEASREVIDLLEAFEARGYRPVDALKRAVGYVFPNGPSAEAEEITDPVESIAAKRKAKALRKNAAAAKKQPPSTRGKGLDSDKAGPRAPLNLADLDDDEFDQIDMDSDEMRRARGDFL